MPDYDKIVEEILEAQKQFVGEKQAISVARRSSLELDQEGQIKDYYGSGEVATKVLLQVFYRQTGQAGINFTKRYLNSRGLEIPENVEIPSRDPGVIQQIREKFRSLLKN